MDLAQVIDDSAYTVPAIASIYGVPASTVYGWRRGHSPRDKEKAEKIMYDLRNQPRLEKHPSFGYATPEEIEELQRIGVGARYYQILKAIEKRTKLKGKKK